MLQVMTSTHVAFTDLEIRVVKMHWRTLNDMFPAFADQADSCG